MEPTSITHLERTNDLNQTYRELCFSRYSSGVYLFLLQAVFSEASHWEFGMVIHLFPVRINVWYMFRYIELIRMVNVDRYTMH